MPEVSFHPLPWPPAETCACGETAAWELWIDQERTPLCSECYQLEALRQARNPLELLCDRIHRTWLLYPWDEP